MVLDIMKEYKTLLLLNKERESKCHRQIYKCICKICNLYLTYLHTCCGRI